MLLRAWPSPPLSIRLLHTILAVGHFPPNINDDFCLAFYINPSSMCGRQDKGQGQRTKDIKWLCHQNGSDMDWLVKYSLGYFRFLDGLILAMGKKWTKQRRHSNVSSFPMYITKLFIKSSYEINCITGHIYIVYNMQFIDMCTSFRHKWKGWGIKWREKKW